MSEIITIFGGDAPVGSEKIIGEDTQELLVSIQDAFQIQFGEEGPFPRTVGELCDRVIARQNGTRTTKCLTSVTFYKVRRAFVGVLGVNREQVTPSTMIASLVTRGPHRRRQWRDLEWKTGLRFPVLTHPTWMLIGTLVIAIGVATGLALDGWGHRPLLHSFFVFIGSWLLAGMLWVVLCAMTQLLVWGFPEGAKRLERWSTLFWQRTMAPWQMRLADGMSKRFGRRCAGLFQTRFRSVNRRSTGIPPFRMVSIFSDQEAIPIIRYILSTIFNGFISLDAPHFPHTYLARGS